MEKVSMSIEKVNYVLGFVFDMEKEHILLQLKDHPEFMAGKYNGIGGVMEEGETVWSAMVRETWEETGIEIEVDTWNRFLFLDHQDFSVSVFRVKLPMVSLQFMAEWSERITEVCKIFPLDALPKNMVSNLSWMIPLALDRFVENADVRESPYVQF
jgi:8-oxo-dGTP diphosphatase